MKLSDELVSFVRKGKVRDIYKFQEWIPAGLTPDTLILVATDRISAFDHVLPTDIPDKGHVLAQLAAFWFELTGGVVPNHFIKLIDDEEISGIDDELSPYMGRGMVVKQAERIDVECVVRGYLAGTGWKSYQESGRICGIKLPPGLREAEELPEPIFTPTTKAETGHDEPLTFQEVVDFVGRETAQAIRVRSLALYKYGRDYARARGLIVADTKFEFGFAQNEFGEREAIVIDEIFTPDSSRFWPTDQYQPGRPQPSFDKQFVRDYLETVWDQESDPPDLPLDIVRKTSEKYLEAFKRITGRDIVRP